MTHARFKFALAAAAAIIAAPVALSVAQASPPPPPAVLSCDGVTDNVTALNQGLANGGLVVLPAGVCMTSGMVVVPPGTTLVGAGEGQTIIRGFPNPTRFVLELTGKADVSGLTIDGGATQINYGSAALNVLLGSDGARIHDLEVLNAGDQGIRVQSSNVQVLRTYSHDNWKQGIYVVGSQSTFTRVGGDLVASNLLVNNVRGLSLTSEPGDGIDIDQLTQNVTVQGNTVYNNDIILTEDGSVPDSNGGTRATGHVVTGNTMINGQKNGITVSDHIDNFKINGNTISNVAGYGVTVHSDSLGGTVSRNTVNGATSNGINLSPVPGYANPPLSILITQNTVAGMQPGVAAIVVSSGSTATITSNTVAPSTIFTKTAGAGTTVANNN